MEENTVVNPQDGQAAQGDAAQGAANTEAEAKTPETGVSTGDAAPQERTDAERFSYALKKRVEEERQKMAQESAMKYADDLKFAQEVRQAFAGKGDSDIMNDLLSAQARVFAEENNISEGLALEFIRLRRAAKAPTVDISQEEPPRKEEPAQDAWMTHLARQREAIRATHGVDVLEGLSQEEEAAILKGDMDLNEVFNRRAPLPPVNRGVSATEGPAFDLSKMTDEQYKAFRDELRQKGQIKIRSD